MDTGDLLIQVDAHAENIALVREAVGNRARELGANRAVVDDLRTVVSESCNNVVLHVYPRRRSAAAPRVKARFLLAFTCVAGGAKGPSCSSRCQ